MKILSYNGKKFALLIVFGVGLFWTSEAMAQNYIQAIGLRMGGTGGIAYKHFIDRTQALEAILSSRNNGIQINGLVEKYMPANFNFDDNFFFYYGIGGHFGLERFYPYEFYSVMPWPDVNYRRESYFTMGVDLIGGIEYKMLVAPLTIGLEVKPFLNYVGFRHLDAVVWDTALSVKYTF
ncbi:MAG: hypothetical protein OEY34_00640 [Cyclobacteriaceae bacterium]|nr:hypothetical protein [Cyclobacteriaceae bacterium]